MPTAGDSRRYNGDRPLGDFFSSDILCIFASIINRRRFFKNYECNIEYHMGSVRRVHDSR